MFLSIVIPAYNEEARLPETLRLISDFLERQDYTAEVLVVENGSTDRTADIVREFSVGHPQFRLISIRERGKGIAVKTGMLAAKGEFRFICDADLSMPIDEVSKFLPPSLDGYDVAIASREVPGARRFGEPAYRHLMGRVFNFIVRVLAVPGFADTQCGFKCFTASAAEQVFPKQTMSGWGFDVEVLFIALRQGLRVVEVPVNWYYKENSRINPVRDTFSMFWEVLKVRMNAVKGMYD
jgi:dolichyl-phosphate beta-glucosyltransferase